MGGPRCPPIHQRRIPGIADTRLCRGFGVFGMGEECFFFYLPSFSALDTKENQGLAEAGGFDRIRDYLSSSYVPNLAGVPDALFSFSLQTATRGSLGGGRRCTNCHGRRQVVRYTRPTHLRAAMPPQPHARNVRVRPDRRRRE